MQEMQEMWVRSLGQEDPLEEEMATWSSIPAWKIPWTEEPGGLQSMGSQSQTQLSEHRSTVYSASQLQRSWLFSTDISQTPISVAFSSSCVFLKYSPPTITVKMYVSFKIPVKLPFLPQTRKLVSFPSLSFSPKLLRCFTLNLQLFISRLQTRK